MTAWAFTQSGNPPKRILAAGSTPPAGQIPEGFGFTARAMVTFVKPAVPAPRTTIVTRAESAPCTCPEHCERDHEYD